MGEQFQYLRGRLGAGGALLPIEQRALDDQKHRAERQQDNRNEEDAALDNESYHQLHALRWRGQAHYIAGVLDFDTPRQVTRR